ARNFYGDFSCRTLCITLIYSIFTSPKVVNCVSELRGDHILLDYVHIRVRMGDSDIGHVRGPEAITITVLRARNLRGNKGETLNSVVKVEHIDKQLGETPKVECSPESPAEYNYSTQLNATFEDPLSLDEFAHRPVLLTVVEVLAKEKKQKEEKTIQLGQCTVDLIHLVKGELKRKYTLQIHPLPGSPLESVPAENPKAELDVVAFVGEPLLTEPQLQDSNLMSVSVESMYSPPDAWMPSGPQFIYTVALPIPITGEKENTVVFPAGSLKMAAEKEFISKQKRWPNTTNMQGGAVYIPESCLPTDNIEDEDGDLRSRDEREHRSIAEQEKNRVVWNTERRCFLDPQAVKSFQEKIAKNRYWPVEVMRMAVPTAGKGKKGANDDDGHFSFHGVCYINMAPLLYPGVKRIRGAYKVHAFLEHDVAEKTSRKGGLAEEAAKIASGIMFRSSSSPFPKKGKDDVKGKDAKKAASAMMKPADSASEADGQPQNVEGQQYVEAKSYIMLEIDLLQPLVHKRPPEELAQRVAEYIPPRPLFPKRTNGAEKAVEDYHNQIASVADLVLEEFRESFGDELRAGNAPLTTDSMEARRQGLLYSLNASGKYFAFKERLKHSVVKIVREKYLRTTSFEDKDQLQAFLSELYVYLVDQMHVGLGKVLSIEDQTPVPEPLTDSAQLKHFAREAEVNENFELAAKYYQERIARTRNDPEHWFDYGTFCLYINDITKAEECFKECVSINQKHLNGLLLYGVVCAMQDQNEAAETFFEAATCVDPQCILAWVMLGLFYDGVCNEIGAEMAFLEANKLNVQVTRQLMEDEKQKERELHEKEEDKLLMDAARDAHGDALAVPSVKNTPATPSGLESKQNSMTSKSQMLKKGQQKKPGVSSSQNKSMESVASMRPGSQTRGSQRGTPMPEPEEIDEPPPREPTPVPTSTVFMQAIEWLLEVKAMPFTERALAHELLEPNGGPGAIYHIAYARLKLQKKEMEEAELSLKEALQFDHQNPDAWAIMGHVKYLVGDSMAAKDCYERTLSFIGDASEMHSIYLRLASIYLQEGKFQEAKNCFLMACKKSPSCVSWVGVGIACYRLGELSEAEDALSEANILNNSDPEVWGYLSLVCLKTNRQLEAEQAYKYALKVNLVDEELLGEIHGVQQEVGFGNPEM
ncbi:unnamed protein product, partial [Owenia fusiformis]